MGDDKNKSLSVLVLGDSFSSDPYVSTKSMWYGILQNELSKTFRENITINVIRARRIWKSPRIFNYEKIKFK